MMPQSIRSGRFGASPSWGRRAAGGAFAAAVLILLVLAVLQLGILGELPGKAGAHLTAISLSGDRAAPRARRAAPTRTAARSQPQAVPTAQPVPQPTRTPFRLIELSHSEFAAADISKMSGHDSSREASGGGDSKAVYGPGEGPGGARLYNAEWVREPTSAEMAGYMPQSGAEPGSWAVIACKTVEHFHVDNCQQLDESPAGSGLARALRLAAWQFLVRPPRINGEPQVGTWVRIRFDFTRGRAG